MKSKPASHRKCQPVGVRWMRSLADLIVSVVNDNRLVGSKGCVNLTGDLLNLGGHVWKTAKTLRHNKSPISIVILVVESRKAQRGNKKTIVCRIDYRLKRGSVGKSVLRGLELIQDPKFKKKPRSNGVVLDDSALLGQTVANGERHISLANVPHHLPRKAGTPDADGKGAA